MLYITGGAALFEIMLLFILVYYGKYILLGYILIIILINIIRRL